MNIKGKSIDFDNLGSDVLLSLYFVEAGGKCGLDATFEFVEVNEKWQLCVLKSNMSIEVCRKY